MQNVTFEMESFWKMRKFDIVVPDETMRAEIQDKIVESIEVTFLQLKEISSVTILVNGEKVFQ